MRKKHSDDKKKKKVITPLILELRRERSAWNTRVSSRTAGTVHVSKHPPPQKKKVEEQT